MMKGISHIEVNVPDYKKALPFYDRMFGWLGWKSFSTLGIDYMGTYYTAFPHSYIGIQPAKIDESARSHTKQRTGLNHISLSAKSKKQVDHFYHDFLLPEGVIVTEKPTYYDYTPTYYAVFFNDVAGIHWELAYMPLIPSPIALWKWWKYGKKLKNEHPEWKRNVWFEAQRKLPK